MQWIKQKESYNFHVIWRDLREQRKGILLVLNRKEG